MTLGELRTLFKKMAAQQEEEAEAFIEEYLDRASPQQGFPYRMVLGRIGQVLPINDWTGNLHNYIDPLNRHAVLHGLRSDYGTKKNSLKAVPWFNHVSQFRDLLLARAATAAADACVDPDTRTAENFKMADALHEAGQPATQRFK